MTLTSLCKLYLLNKYKMHDRIAIDPDIYKKWSQPKSSTPPPAKKPEPPPVKETPKVVSKQPKEFALSTKKGGEVTPNKAYERIKTLLQAPSPIIAVATTDAEYAENNAFFDKFVEAIVGKLGRCQHIKNALEREPLEKGEIRLLIGTKDSLRNSPFTKELYAKREGVHWLGEAKLVVIDDVAKLIDDPQVKRQLWNKVRSQL